MAKISESEMIGNEGNKNIKGLWSMSQLELKMKDCLGKIYSWNFLWKRRVEIIPRKEHWGCGLALFSHDVMSLCEIWTEGSFGNE